MRFIDTYHTEKTVIERIRTEQNGKRGVKMGSDEVFQAFDDAAFHSWGDVAVRVHGLGKGGMSQAILDDFEVDAGFDQERRMGMTEGVERESFRHP